VTPDQFCAFALAEYERQWAASVGHQQRHPLRVKMELLGQLRKQAAQQSDFDKLLRDGLSSDDPRLAMLCAELAPRWERLQRP
jgi:hypothetical protein